MSETAVYKTGTLGAIIEHNEAAASQAVANEPNQEIPTSNETPASVETPQQPQNTPATQEPVQETNVSTFKFDVFEESQPQEASSIQDVAKSQVTDWKDLLKTVDRKELLKEVGLNDFALELDEYMKKGGDPADYLYAKAVDYNKVSDEELIKEDFKKQFPNFTPQEINRLFNRKYGVSEDADEETREDKLLELKADAHVKRQQKIAEQQNFKIPSAQVQPTTVDTQAEALANQQAIEAARQWYNSHEATQNLMSSKRVTLDLGDNGKFNFNIERPDLLMKAVTDADTWQKLTSTKQGEPDVQKMQKIALYAFNPEQFEADLVNYGKSLALPQLLKEGQNVTPSAKVLPMQNQNVNEKDLWKNAKSGTIGGR